MNKLSQLRYLSQFPRDFPNFYSVANDFGAQYLASKMFETGASAGNAMSHIWNPVRYRYAGDRPKKVHLLRLPHNAGWQKSKGRNILARKFRRGHGGHDYILTRKTFTIR